MFDQSSSNRSFQVRHVTGTKQLPLILLISHIHVEKDLITPQCRKLQSQKGQELTLS